MASVIVALRIMPSSPDANLAEVEKEAAKAIVDFSGKVVKTEITPIAFGLNALIFHFVMKEEIGSTEILEQSIARMDGVGGVEVVDVRRVVG